MSQYFRITAYHPKEDISIIADSNGMYEKLWQFSAFLVSKGFQILEVGNDEHFTDINIEKAQPTPDHIILRAAAKGKPIYIEKCSKGIESKFVNVGNSSYIVRTKI